MYNSLLKKINYEFKNIKLLEKALSHRSVRGVNNERLEFLGDSILNFVIAAKLFTKFPKAREGELSRLRANLVNGSMLAEIALEFGLGQFLKLGTGELKSGGSRRESILADALEAIIGAIYLDDSVYACQTCILDWYESRLDNITSVKVIKDPKTRLQEFLQAQKIELPAYTIARIEGEAHAQIFHVTCEVTGVEIVTSGAGSSRRKAEQQAAEAFLKAILDTNKQDD